MYCSSAKPPASNASSREACNLTHPKLLTTKKKIGKQANTHIHTHEHISFTYREDANTVHHKVVEGFVKVMDKMGI